MAEKVQIHGASLGKCSKSQIAPHFTAGTSACEKAQSFPLDNHLLRKLKRESIGGHEFNDSKNDPAPNDQTALVISESSLGSPKVAKCPAKSGNSFIMITPGFWYADGADEELEKVSLVLIDSRTPGNDFSSN